MPRSGLDSSAHSEYTVLSPPQSPHDSEKLIETKTYLTGSNSYTNGIANKISPILHKDDSLSRQSSGFMIYKCKSDITTDSSASFTKFYHNVSKIKNAQNSMVQEEIFNWLKKRHDGTDIEEHVDMPISPKLQVSDTICDRSLWSSSMLSSCTNRGLERAIVLVKPNAMPYKDAILKAIFDHGFQIVNQRVVHLSPEQAFEIYAKYYGSPSFPTLITAVSEKPVLVLSLAANNAVNKWKKIVGNQNGVCREWFFPLSMRKMFGLCSDMPSTIHCSEDSKSAVKENRYFFPNSLLDPIKQDLLKVTDYCNLYINETLSKGLSVLASKRPVDPILFLADWLLEQNPFLPQYNNIVKKVQYKYVY